MQAGPGELPRILGRLLLMAVLGLAAPSWGQEAEPPTEPDAPKIGRFGEDSATSAEGYRFTEAETLLWRSDHLQNVHKPQRLLYRFKKSGTLEENFEDSVQLEVRALHEDGTKTVGLQFFHGKRRLHAQQRNTHQVRGNPVLGFYLQEEVQEMERRTNGGWRHFQRRIKLALADPVEVEDVSIDFQGSPVQARKITLRPYLSDPRRSQYQDLAHKVYEFIFSEHVPGTLYKISSVLPARDSGAESLIEEVLIFSGSEKI